MNPFFVTFAIGLTAGVFGGLIGLGGGLIMIPLLIGVLKLSQHQAHGTSLVALTFTGISGAMVYGLHGDIDVFAATLLAVAAILTARAGAHYANALPAWKLRRVFGFFLLCCALLLMAKSYISPSAARHALVVNAALFLVTGVITGFLSGMLGVGGGTVMIPAMVLLAGFSQHIAQGTSLTVMVPVGIVGALTHYKLGNVVPRHLVGLVPGIVLGVFVGGSVAKLIPDTPLRLAFVAVIVMMGINYLRVRRPNRV
jgi:uncharacterized membrane protein YfcA